MRNVSVDALFIQLEISYYKKVYYLPIHSIQVRNKKDRLAKCSVREV